MELVVYDEVQYFRKWDSELFEYPYIDRKNKENTFKLSFIKENVDYPYLHTELEFHKATVCLEAPFYQQLFFLKDLWQQLVINFNILVELIQQEKKKEQDPNLEKVKVK